MKFSADVPRLGTDGPGSGTLGCGGGIGSHKMRRYTPESPGGCPERGLLAPTGKSVSVKYVTRKVYRGN